MTNVNFDQQIDRRHTNCTKYDGMAATFGRTDVMPMWIADMDFPVSKEITAAIRLRADHPVYGYNTIPEGYFSAFTGWVQKHHGWTIQLEWVCHTPGVLTALSAAILAFTEKGDKVLIQPPVYFPFSSTIEALGRQVLNSPLRYEDGRFCMDFADLEEKAREARLFILCSPHNPAGRVWTREELERTEEICRKNDLFVFSDEIHSDIVFQPAQHILFPSLSDWSRDHCVLAMAPSKTFNIAGLEASFITIPNQERRERYQHLLRYGLHVANCNTFGLAAAQAAYERGGPWYDELMAYLKGNMDYLDRALREQVPQVRLVHSEATYILFLDMRDLGLEPEALQTFLLDKVRVALNPGPTFGPGGEGFMRINIATQRANLEQFVERLKVQVAQLHV